MTDSKSIRVLIADDHAVVRNGLSSFIATCDDFELVGEAKNGEHAVRLSEQYRPDVVLMDLVMPLMDGITATRRIREKHPDTQVIALTSFKEQDQVKEAIQAGAIGYLLKDISADELADAIRRAHAGIPILAPEAVEVLIQFARQPDLRPGDDFTDREFEVLELMVEGARNQEISEHLFVSMATVKSHVGNILSKLGVTSRTEAVAYALKNGLVSKSSRDPKS
jgi:NarL family two-component system response regulator LiaR